MALLRQIRTNGRAFIEMSASRIFIATATLWGLVNLQKPSFYRQRLPLSPPRLPRIKPIRSFQVHSITAPDESEHRTRIPPFTFESKIPSDIVFDATEDEQDDGEWP